jgi:hypothetical protein
MLRDRIAKSAPWLALVILLLSGPVMADSLDIEVSRGAIIYNVDSTDARLLIGFTLPEALDSAEIKFAELRVPIISLIPDSTALTVYCRPLLIPWEPDDIAWGDLGDFPDTAVVAGKGTHFGTARIGSQAAFFDITRIVGKWLGGSLANRGLVLYANPLLQSRFSHQRHGDGPYAIVHVEFERPAN